MSATIDIIMAVERILPAAVYYGSVTANTEDAWNAVDWRDPRRDKPSWAEVVAAAPDPLAEALACANAAITARRKQAEYGGFDFNDQRWDSEEKDELRLNSILTMMDKFNISEFPGWKINADTFITLSQPVALQAAASMMQHYNACFQVEAEKKAVLAAANPDSAADVEAWLAANLDTGWPGGPREHGGESAA